MADGAWPGTRACRRSSILLKGGSGRFGGSISFEATTLFGKVLDIEAGVDIWESTPFALDFGKIAERNGGFLVYVGAEPGSALLLFAGLAGFLVLSQRGGGQ
jgi:hypothetical protein